MPADRSLKFTYQNNNLKTLEDIEHGQYSDDISLITFSYGTDINKSNILTPELSYDDGFILTPLFYAGLLGKASKNLPISSIETNNQGFEPWNRSYFYTFKDGYISTCMLNDNGSIYTIEYVHEN